MDVQLTCSIVLYKNEVEVLSKTIHAVLNSSFTQKLYLIDNSPTDSLKQFVGNVGDNRIVYIFNNANLGYGKAHNIALKEAVEYAKYHLVLNPDIDFEPGVLENIFQFMENDQNVGLLLPNVLYRNGDLQKLCNLLPRPVDLVSRRFFSNADWAKKVNDEYELKGFNYGSTMNIPNLSGCFMFIRCSTLKQVGFFDERYFMYMEDVDLCRRIHAVSKTIFYPEVSIIHGFEKESYSNKKLLKYHIQSAIKYFNKWGWIFDKQRDCFNNRILDLVSLSNKH